MEEQPKQFPELTPGDMVLEASASGGDFEDYVSLDPGEPIKAHIVSTRPGQKMFKGEYQDKLFVYFEVDEGPGKGQRYRGDFNPTITSPTSPKQSNLSKFATLVFGEAPTTLDPTDLLGRPIRILLSEPWGDKGLQYANTYLKASADQKTVKIEPKDTDHVLTDEELKAAGLL
jgi:hypothetical protein